MNAFSTTLPADGLAYWSVPAEGSDTFESSGVNSAGVAISATGASRGRAHAAQGAAGGIGRRAAGRTQRKDHAASAVVRPVAGAGRRHASPGSHPRHVVGRLIQPIFFFPFFLPQKPSTLTTTSRKSTPW